MRRKAQIPATFICNGIPVDFSGETLAQTKQLPTAVSAQDKIGRVDITDCNQANYLLHQYSSHKSYIGVLHQD
jgi:exoribonuclease R